MTVAEIAKLLPRFRYRFGRETELHAGIAAVLDQAGVAYQREAIAGPADRFDFLLADGVVIEAKCRGSAGDALRQVARYCERDDVTAVVLVSSRAWAIEPYLELSGKPVHVVKIGAGL